MAERYGWINRALPDADLDGFVANFVRRVLSFDSQALSTAKAILNHTGLPNEAENRKTAAVPTKLGEGHTNSDPVRCPRGAKRIG